MSIVPHPNGGSPEEAGREVEPELPSDSSDLERRFESFRTLRLVYRTGNPGVTIMHLKEVLNDTVYYSLLPSDAPVPLVEVRYNALKKRNSEMYKNIERRFSSRNIRYEKTSRLDERFMMTAIEETAADLRKVIIARHRVVD